MRASKPNSWWGVLAIIACALLALIFKPPTKGH